VLADVASDAGKLALPDKHAAHVALIQVSKESKARIASVRMLAGKPRPGEARDIGASAGFAGPGGMSAMRAVRRQHMSTCTRSQPEPELPPLTLQGGFMHPQMQMPPMQHMSASAYARSQPEPELPPQTLQGGYAHPQVQMTPMQHQPRVRQGVYSQMQLQTPPQTPQMPVSSMSMQPQMQTVSMQQQQQQEHRNQQRQQQQQQQAPTQMRAQRALTQGASMPPQVPFPQPRAQAPPQGQ